MSNELKNILEKNIISQIPSKENVALLLSGGVDSTSLLFMLKELQYNVVAYSFFVKGNKSTDYKTAKQTASIMNIPFREIVLDFYDVNILYNEIKEIKHRYDLKKKTEIECSYVIFKAMQNTEENFIVTGHCADINFVLSKKGMMHYKETVLDMQKYKTQLLNQKNYNQKDTLVLMANNLNKKIIMPYCDRDIYNLFYTYSWDMLNTPKQKMPILNMYPELFQKTETKRHTNFHLGDSMIASTIKHNLLSSRYNVNGFKSTVGIYNKM